MNSWTKWRILITGELASLMNSSFTVSNRGMLTILTWLFLQENGSRQENGERHLAVRRADPAGESSAERTVWRRQLQRV